MEGFLKYGDTIVLYANYDLAKQGLELSQSGLLSLKSKGNRIRGFLTTKGFLDSSVKFQTINTQVDQEMLEVENVTNLRDFTFIVTPKLKSEFHKEYSVAHSEFKQLEKAFNNIDMSKIEEETKKDFKAELDNFEQKVKKAKSRAKNEKRRNLNIINSHKGKHVTYGAEIQLMHRDSGSYICAKTECSKTEQIGYKIGISTEFNSRMVFTFEPKYKTRHEGDLIQYTDMVRLKNTKNEGYLAISLSNYEGPEEHYQEETNPYITPKVLIDPICTLHTVYVGESHFSDWQVFLEGKNEIEESNQDILRGGDLIRIKHSQINAYLSSSVCFERENPEVYFRNYNGVHQAENDSLNSIWEIYHNRKIEQGNSFTFMNNGIILRHFNSGRIIQIDPNTGELNLQRLDLSYDHSVEDDIVYIFALQLGTRNLKSGLSYKIKYISKTGEEKYLSQTDKYCSIEALDNKDQTFKIRNESKFEPLEDHFYDETRLVAYFSDINKVEEAYVIQKVNPQEIKDILFMRSALLPILKVSRFFKNVDMRNLKEKNGMNRDKALLRIDNQKVVDTEYLLKKIICYLFDIEYKPDVDYKVEKFENMDPLESRQRILKDLNFLEILMDLIHFPLHHEHYNVADVHTDLYVPDMLTTAYICIKIGIKEYRPNELYASQWLDLMISYSLSELNENIQANETLTELIDNNQRILETRIRRETINRFIQNLISQNRDSKYVHILRAICICDDKPMLKNQNIITEILLQDPSVRDKLVRPMVIQNNIVNILKPDDPNGDLRGMDDWVQLVSIKEDPDLGEKYFDYLCSFIYLLADLCRDRNYAAIEILKEYFSDEICIRIIESNLYDEELKSAVCKLTENLLIDAKPFMQLMIPCNIKNWSKKQEAVSSIIHGAQKNKDQLEKYKNLIDFVFKYLQTFGEKEKWEGSLTFTLVILQLCTRMVNVGFINEQEKMRELFINLKNILKKSDQEIHRICKEQFDGIGKFVFNHSKAEIQEDMMNLKKQACELMRLLLQIQTDLRLDLIMQTYRLKNPEKKNSLESDPTENNGEDEEAEPLGIALLKKVAARKNEIDIEEEKNKNQEIKKIFEDLINDQETFCFVKKNDDDFISCILNQCLYSSSELKEIALELINLMFRESETMKLRFKEIQIIHQEKSIKQLGLLENISETLFVLGESMEIWYNNNDQKQIKYLYLVVRRLEAMLDESENYTNINIKQEKITGTKFESDIKDILESNRFLETFLDCSFENISLFQQDLTRNTSCIEYLIDILENSFKGQETFSYSLDKVNITFKIILILAKCCFNNSKNKLYLTKYIEELFLPKLTEDISINHVTILLNHLVENNKIILLDENRSRNIISSIFNNFFKEKENYYRIAFNMNTLQKFIFFDKECLKYNQNAVISNLISTRLQTIFKSLSTENLIHTLTDNLKHQNYEFNYGDKNVLLFNDRLCFSLSYLELISNCSFDKNAFSENIAQSLITIEDMERIISNFSEDVDKSMLHRIVVYEIIKFNFHVYVDTERLYTTQIGTCLLEIMMNVKEILLKTLNFLNKGHRITYCLTHKELVTSSNICVDLIFCCIDNLRVYIQQVAKDANTKINLERLNNLVNYLVTDLEQMYQKIGRQIVKHKVAHLLCAIQEVKEKSNFIKSDASIERKLTKNVSSIKKEVEKDELFKEISDVGNLRESQLFTIMRQNLVFGDRQYRKQMKLNSTRFENESREFIKSQRFQQISEKEFKRLINWAHSHTHQAIFETFLEKLVPYMNPEDNTNNEIIGLGLTIFKNYADPDFEEKEDEFKKSKRIKLRQDFLIKIGVVELLGKLITNSQDIKVFSTAIEVGVKILEGGNVDGQMEFLKIFKELESKDIIAKILNVLKLNFDKIANFMVKKNNIKLKKLVLGPKFNEYIGSEHENYHLFNKNCQLIFEFFRLLCEGHNSDLQNHLRIGTGYNDINKMKSEENNVIRSVSALFGSYIKFFNSDCIELGVKMIDFMIETVQGPCRGNQTEMINSKIVVFCKDFLNDLNSDAEDLKIKGFHIESKIKEVVDRDLDILNNLFSTTINLLLSILESNRNQRVIKKIGSSVQPNYLIDKLTAIFYNYMEEKGINAETKSVESITLNLNTKLFEEDLKEAFDIYFFIQIINENTGLYTYDLKNMTKYQEKAYQFFERNSATIEIIFEDQLQKIHFMKHPTTNYLDKEHKTELMDSVRRDNPNEKITDFFAATPMLFDKMNHTFSLIKKYKMKAAYLLFIQDIALIVSLIINGNIFWNFKLKIENTVGLTNSDLMKTSFYKVMGIIHLSISALMLIIQIIINSRVILMDKWRNYFTEFKIDFRQKAKDDNLQHQLMLATLEKNVSEISFSEHRKILKMRREMEMGSSEYVTLPTLNYIANNFMFILSDYGFIYFIFYFTCSLIAFIFKIPFLYAFSLFEIINRFDTLRNVIKAITFNKEQLLLTLLLQGVTIYIYSLFAYYYLIDTFWNDNFGVAGENQCTSVIQCFMTIFALGPRSSGGIGDMLVRQSFADGNKNKYFIRFAFDCTCFIFANLILQNIVFGIIIDTFAFLRDEKYQREQNKKNMCFACSIKRQSFDKTPEGFEYHIKNDHYIWNYLFYLYYLKHKEQTDYNGIESYVSKLIELEVHDWIPIGKALILQDMIDEEVEIERVYSECYDRVKTVIERNEKLKRESDNDMKFYIQEV